MNGKQITKELNQKQLNYSMLSQAIGTSVSHVYNVAYRNTVSKPVAIKIAKAIEKPFEHVFPDYYEKAEQKKTRGAKVEALANLVNS